MYLKLIVTIVTFIIAFLFTFVFPQSGSEQVIIGLFTIVGTWLGIDWRKQYYEVKLWLKSKTIIGAIIFGTALIAYLTLPLFFNVDENIKLILEVLVYGGGLGFMIGVFDVIGKKTNNKS